MTSKRKAEANRKNGRKGRGPKTPRGKAHSCLNALDDGLHARTPILPWESPEEYERLASDVRDQWRPYGPSKHGLIEHLVGLYWKLRRVPPAENFHFQSVGVTSLIEALETQLSDDERKLYRHIMTQRALASYPSVPLAMQFQMALELVPEDEKKKWTASEAASIQRMRVMYAHSFSPDNILLAGHLSEDAKLERLHRIGAGIVREIIATVALLQALPPTRFKEKPPQKRLKARVAKHKRSHRIQLDR